MMLHCSCANSIADTLYGRGIRPHTKLVKLPGQLQEFICNSCYFVRELAESTAKGRKRKAKSMPFLEALVLASLVAHMENPNG